MNVATLRMRASAGLIATLLVATTVEAQPARRPRDRGPFRGRGARDGLMFLLAVPEVQKELDVAPEQQELLDALQEDLRTQRRGLFRRGRGRRGRGSDRGDRMQSLNRQMEKLVATVLERQQNERLHELRLQHEGLDALDRPEFVEVLGLSEAQIEEIRELRDAERLARFEPERERLSNSERARRDHELETNVWAVLTKKQEQRWKSARGKAFKFPDRQRSGRRGFRNRRGNAR